jgi:NADH-quinone oxidoreductase subunit K
VPQIPTQIQEFLDTLVAAPPLPTAGGLGVSYAVLVLAIAAAEVAVGLAIVLAVFRSRRTVNVDEVTSMRG